MADISTICEHRQTAEEERRSDQQASAQAAETFYRNYRLAVPLQCRKRRVHTIDSETFAH